MSLSSHAQIHTSTFNLSCSQTSVPETSFPYRILRPQLNLSRNATQVMDDAQQPPNPFHDYNRTLKSRDINHQYADGQFQTSPDARRSSFKINQQPVQQSFFLGTLDAEAQSHQQASDQLDRNSAMMNSHLRSDQQPGQSSFYTAPTSPFLQPPITESSLLLTQSVDESVLHKYDEVETPNATPAQASSSSVGDPPYPWGEHSSRLSPLGTEEAHENSGSEARSPATSALEESSAKFWQAWDKEFPLLSIDGVSPPKIPGPVTPASTEQDVNFSEVSANWSQQLSIGGEIPSDLSGLGTAVETIPLRNAAAGEDTPAATGHLGFSGAFNKTFLPPSNGWEISVATPSLGTFTNSTMLGYGSPGCPRRTTVPANQQSIAQGWDNGNISGTFNVSESMCGLDKSGRNLTLGEQLPDTGLHVNDNGYTAGSWNSHEPTHGTIPSQCNLTMQGQLPAFESSSANTGYVTGILNGHGYTYGTTSSSYDSTPAEQLAAFPLHLVGLSEATGKFKAPTPTYSFMPSRHAHTTLGHISASANPNANTSYTDGSLNLSRPVHGTMHPRYDRIPVGQESAFAPPIVSGCRYPTGIFNAPEPSRYDHTTVGQVLACADPNVNNDYTTGSLNPFPAISGSMPLQFNFDPTSPSLDSEYSPVPRCQARSDPVPDRPPPSTSADTLAPHSPDQPAFVHDRPPSSPAAQSPVPHTATLLSPFPDRLPPSPIASNPTTDSPTRGGPLCDRLGWKPRSMLLEELSSQLNCAWPADVSKLISFCVSKTPVHYIPYYQYPTPNSNSTPSPSSKLLTRQPNLVERR